MTDFRWHLFALATLACARPPDAAEPRLTVSKAVIAADGLATSMIHVAGIGGERVEISTSLGVLTGPDGKSGRTVALQGEGDVVLTSGCDARVSAGCSGAASLRVLLNGRDAGATASVELAAPRPPAHPASAGSGASSAGSAPASTDAVIVMAEGPVTVGDVVRELQRIPPGQRFDTEPFRVAAARSVALRRLLVAEARRRGFSPSAGGPEERERSLLKQLLPPPPDSPAAARAHRRVFDELASSLWKRSSAAIQPRALMAIPLDLPPTRFDSNPMPVRSSTFLLALGGEAVDPVCTVTLSRGVSSYTTDCGSSTFFADDAGPEDLLYLDVLQTEPGAGVGYRMTPAGIRPAKLYVTAGTADTAARAVAPDAPAGSAPDVSGTRLVPAGAWRAAQIASSGNVHCAVTTAGDVVCWGTARYGATDRTLYEETRPLRVTGLAAPAVAVAPGADHACALLRDGRVQCWGLNEYGQLGVDGGRTERPGRTIAGLAAVAIASGADFSCALDADGGVRCWGRNQSGELGDDTRSNRSHPAPVVGLTSGVRSLYLHDRTACAGLAGGEVRCWGEMVGPLFIPGATSRPHPTRMPFLEGMTDLTLGAFLCGRDAGGHVHCTGCDFARPDGTCWANSRVPRLFRVELGASARSLAGVYVTACAAGSDGGVRCWGSGPLGLPKPTGKADPWHSPTLVEGVGDVEQVSATQGAVCARTVEGRVWCWGGRGQLGSGSGLGSDTPVPVAME